VKILRSQTGLCFEEENKASRINYMNIFSNINAVGKAALLLCQNFVNAKGKCY